MTEEQVLLSKYHLVDGTVYGKRGQLHGTKMANGYVATRVWIGDKCKRVSLHRLVFLLSNGYLPDTVDHINGIRDDNRPENLREATHRQQQINRKTKGYTIRTFRYSKPRYEVNCDHQYIGVYDTEEEARLAYQAARRAAFDEAFIPRTL
jgi:hypothetical protein